MATVLRQAIADKEAQEELVRATDLDWVIVRPGGLTDRPAAGKYQVGTAVKAGQVSRADVAEFVLQQFSDDTYLRQAVSIS